MSPPNEREFAGQPVVPGIAIGPAWRLIEGAVETRSRSPARTELAVFEKAIGDARRALVDLADASDELGREILEFQVALLEDDELLDRVRQSIEGGKSADAAWDEIFGAEIAGQTRDDMSTSRVSDYRDLHERVLDLIAGRNRARQDFPAGAILFARDMLPSRFLSLDLGRTAAIVLSGGSSTSHIAILARSRGIPMVVDLLPEPDPSNGETVAIDAGAGRVVASPSAATQERFRRTQKTDAQLDEEARRIALQPAMTGNDKPLRVLVNINHPGELASLDPAICDGIGLVRTEFLFSHGAPPEDDQYVAYRGLLDWAAGRPVTIRTLDAGGDKPIAGVTHDGESNPFLGMRGLRLSLRRPDIFRTQLRALLRAAANGPVKIMLPMVTLPHELTAARQLLEEAAAELRREGLAHAMPPVGIMIEVPAAALTAGEFNADFYSIGSNDLTQYVMAVARDSSGLSHLSRGDHPAVMELIRRTIEAGAKRDVEVSLCGDLASRPEMVRPLLEAGLAAFSVAPSAVGRVKLEMSRFHTQAVS